MKNLLYILALATTMVACNMEAEEELTWDIEKHPDMLVIESIITNEYKEQAIRITLSNPYFDYKTPKNVTNADVVVEGGTKPIHFTERAEAPGWYFSEELFACEPLKTYTLSISLAQSINGQSDYTATSKMPKGLDIDSMICELYEMPEFDFDDEEEDKDTTILGLYYFGNEPAEAENYYFTKVFVNNKMVRDNPKEYNYFSITAANANYTHMNGYVFNAGDADTVRFRLYTIDKDYYSYLESLQKIDDTGNAFSMSGPPANAIGNISNGKGLGYFLAAYVSEKTGYINDKRKSKPANQ